MNWYVEALKKYTVFTGRSQRSEYWFFTLFNIIISVVIGLVEGFVGSPSILGLLYTFAVLLPGLAVSVRRLHDTNHSGWWLLIALIPLVGAVILLIFMVTDSTPGENQYGVNPKEA